MKMNYYVLFYLFFTSLTFYAQEKNIEPQFFDLNTISEKEIFCKNGTVVYFFRDDFNIEKNANIQFEITENYKSKGINLDFSFKVNEKEIGLKKGKKLEIYSPKNNLRFSQYHIFESLINKGEINWIRMNDLYEIVIVEISGGISEETFMHKDSISKYRGDKNKSFKTKEEYEKEHENLKNKYPNYIFNSFRHIYFDFFINVKNRINFKIEKTKDSFFNYKSYIVYKNYTAFKDNYLFEDKDFFFTNVPLFDETYLIIIDEKRENDFYYDKIELKKIMHNSTIQLNMKKTNKEELKKLFDL